MDLFDCDPRFYKIDGITLGSNFPREAVEKATSLDFSTSDILSATYPKTGNNKGSAANSPAVHCKNATLYQIDIFI